MRIRNYILIPLLVTFFVSCDDDSISNDTDNTEIPKDTVVNVSYNVDHYQIDKLVAYYPLNGNANDIIGELNGEFTNISFLKDRFGNESSCYYSNKDNFIDIEDKYGKLDFDSSFTIATWIRAVNVDDQNSYQSKVNIVSKYMLDVNERSYFIGVNEAGGYESGTYDGTDHFLNHSGNFDDSDWHLITYSYDSDQSIGSLVIDAELVASQYMGKPVNRGISLRIGGSPDGHDAFVGFIDDVMFFNDVLDLSTIEEIYSYNDNFKDTSLHDDFVYDNKIIDDAQVLSYYPFNGNPKDIIGDLDGVENNVSYVEDRFGNSEGALHTPRDGFIDVFDENTFDFEGSFSISTWVKLKPNAQHQDWKGHIDILGKWGGGDNLDSYMIALTTNDEFAFWIDNGDNEVLIGKSSATQTASGWHNLTITFNNDNNKALFYIDGEVIGERTTTLPRKSAKRLRIGGRSDGFADFDGYIDDIIIFSSALSQAKVVELVNDK